MFGYVRPSVPDLLVREHEFYRAAYCGLCRSMRRRTGHLSAMTLRYDLVFLALARMLYGEREVKVSRRRCPAHPFRRRPVMEETPALAYAARAGALLAYAKVQDDRLDGTWLRRLLLAFPAAGLRRGARRARLPALQTSLTAHLAELHRLEEAATPSVDAAADVFGSLLGDVFCGDMPSADALALQQLGYHLGRFIYAADAAEDYEADGRTGSYNPYRCLYGTPVLTPAQKQDIHTALLLELGKVEAALQQLPLEGADAVRHILENTIYVGLPARISFLLGQAESERNAT